MSHTILGRLRGSLLDECYHRDDGDHKDDCGPCCEPLAGMVVRIYSTDDTTAGNPTDTPRILNTATVESRAARLLVEATTYPDGTFAATLPEDRYDRGALDIDVYCRTVPRLKRQDESRNPVQVHVATLRPEWTGEPYWEVSFDHILPASTWLEVRARFGAWVICGRVVEGESRQKVAGAVVRAYDTDWLQDDPLGAVMTDFYGHYRLDYTDRDFKRTPLSPFVNFELVQGPDLYFRVEAYDGTRLLDEQRSVGRTPDRKNVRPGVCVELAVAGPAPQPRLYDLAWMERRRAEIDSSLTGNRAPIGRDGEVYFRPWELLIGPGAVKKLWPELEDRYGARPYDPDDPDHWRHRYEAARRGRIAGCEWPPVVRRRAAGRPADESPLRLYVLRSDLEPNSMAWVVRTLRSRLSEKESGPADGVHLNHVLFAEPIYQGGPEGDPVPPESGPGTPPPETVPSDPNIAVLDTGVWEGLPSVHGELAGRLTVDSTDTDLLDEAGDGRLDSCAGHGAFICGLIYRMHAGLRLDAGRVLTPSGNGDDETITKELREVEARGTKVVNLSLGGYTVDNREPPGLAPFIRSMVSKGYVVVAAAGNNPNGGDVRPSWPAAMPEVIAVGSWGRAPSGGPIRAFSSNYGSWVDVYANGVEVVSAYVNGRQNFTGWALWNGTSFAAPKVAAEVAIRVQADKSKTHKQVENEMFGTGSGRLPLWPNSDGNPNARLYRNQRVDPPLS